MLPPSKRWYAGVDLHKSYSYVTVMDKEGVVEYQGKHKHKDQSLVPVLKRFSGLVASIESTYGWYSQADEFESHSIPFVLAHPTKINAIAGKKKTDKGDSKILADLHRTNLLPQSFVPTKPQRELRQLVRFRIQLVQNQTVIKTRIRDLLVKQRLNCQFSDILGQKSRAWLASQALSPVYRKQINSLLRQADTNGDELLTYNKIITTWSKQDFQARLLQTIPGIGPVVSVLIVSEIGSIDRFPNPRAFASYCGVTPSVKSSGGKTFLGKTNKHANPYLRWCLAEAVVHLVKKDPVAGFKYARLWATKGKGKAKVAMMNKLARIIYSILKRQTPYYIDKLPPSD